MLKLQYFGHLMQRADSLEKTLMLGKIEGRRRRGWQRVRWLDGIIDSMGMNLSRLQTQWRVWRPGMLLQPVGAQRVRHNWATERQQDVRLVHSQSPETLSARQELLWETPSNKCFQGPTRYPGEKVRLNPLPKPREAKSRDHGHQEPWRDERF